jgi:hypothetical protein
MNKEFQHESLAEGRWFKMTLAEQLGNIGSEVGRVMRARNDPKRRENAAFRALELFELTLSDPRWKSRLKEIARAREIFCDDVYGQGEYGITLEDLDRYFNMFAYAARVHK